MPLAEAIGFSSSDWILIVGFAATAAVYVTAGRIGNKIVEGKLEIIDATIEDFKEEIRKLNEVIVTQAVQTSRIGIMEERLLQEGRRMDSMARAINRILFKLAIPINPLPLGEREEEE